MYQTSFTSRLLQTARYVKPVRSILSMLAEYRAITYLDGLGGLVDPRGGVQKCNRQIFSLKITKRNRICRDTGTELKS